MGMSAQFSFTLAKTSVSELTKAICWMLEACQRYGESSVISYGFAISQMLLFYDQICYQKAAKLFIFHIEQLLTCNSLKKKISAHFGKYFSRV